MLLIIPSFHYEGHTVSLIGSIEKMILIRLIPYDTRMEIIENSRSFPKIHVYNNKTLQEE